MLFNKEIIETVHDVIKDLSIPIILDPISISKAGSPLALEAIKTLFEHVTLITPNQHGMTAKLEASKDLKKIVSKSTSTMETRFTNSLDQWYSMYEEFINEKSLNETTGKEYFTHRKLVAAYKSLRRNLPYLFTYKITLS